MNKKMKRTCNQCMKPMIKMKRIVFGGKPSIFSVCDNPTCPNYALVQISVEQMLKLFQSKLVRAI